MTDHDAPSLRHTNQLPTLPPAPRTSAHRTTGRHAATGVIPYDSLERAAATLALNGIHPPLTGRHHHPEADTQLRHASTLYRNATILGQVAA